MRQILVDYARRQQTAKRGGGEAQFSLNQTSEFPIEERIQLSESRSEEMLAVDEALKRLAAFDERLSQIVDAVFCGLYHRRDRRRAEPLAHHRQTRMDHGAGLALPRVELTRLRMADGVRYLLRRA